MSRATELIDISQGVAGAVVVEGTAKAWTTLQGSGTAQHLGSYNMSSVTDNGVGIYDVGFTNSFLNSSFNSVFGSTSANVGFPSTVDEGRTTTRLSIGVARVSTEGRADVARFSMTLNGDLA